MSITEQAKAEMVRANFPADEIEAMGNILGLFFDTWDSGGAVHVMAPVLQRLIAGKPLSPLTGADDEWVDHENGTFQNKRCGTVFKEKDMNGNWIAYDIDLKLNAKKLVVTDQPQRHHWAPYEIAFPYLPIEAEVGDPVVTINTANKDIS